MWKTAFPVLFCLTSSVHAGIVFEAGNNPQPDEENVLLNTGSSGTTIFGQTNTSGLTVQFTSLETLTAPSNGQARVEAEDGELNDVTISVPDHNFLDFIGNAFTGSGVATITVFFNGLNSTFFNLDLGNGQNFFTIFAEDGDTIDSVNINAPDGFSDLRQPRISGLAGPDIDPHVTPTPEPATFTIMLGLAAVVLGSRSRRLSSLMRRAP